MKSEDIYFKQSSKFTGKQEKTSPLNDVNHHKFLVILDWLVPDNTVHKGTSERLKTDKNDPFGSARLSINI